MDIGYLKQVGKYLITVALSVAIILYILYHLFGGYETTVETTAATYVTTEETLTLDAYIMRNEITLYSGSSGSINYLCADGAKLSRNEVVAAIYSDGSIQERLMEIDNKIAVLESSNLTNALAIVDTNTIDSKINTIYYQMLEYLGRGELELAMRRKEEILVSLNKRQIIVKNIESYDEQIAALKEERDLLASSATAVSEYVTSPSSGYFYTELDGYETAFNSADISTMQMSDYDVMINSEADQSGVSEIGARAIGKVDTDYVWYLVCEMTKEQYRAIAGEKTSFSVIFPSNNDKRLELELYRVVNPADDERVLFILASGYRLDDFNFLRRQSVDIVTNSYSGYQVPVSAVRLVDGVQGVYILEGSTVYFREIVPLFEKDSYVICEPRDANDESQINRLDLYDFIVTKGKNLSDGKMVS